MYISQESSSIRIKVRARLLHFFQVASNTTGYGNWQHHFVVPSLSCMTKRPVLRVVPSQAKCTKHDTHRIKTTKQHTYRTRLHETAWQAECLGKAPIHTAAPRITNKRHTHNKNKYKKPRRETQGPGMLYMLPTKIKHTAVLKCAMN